MGDNAPAQKVSRRALPLKPVAFIAKLEIRGTLEKNEVIRCRGCVMDQAAEIGINHDALAEIIPAFMTWQTFVAIDARDDNSTMAPVDPDDVSRHGFIPVRIAHVRISN